MKQHGGDDDDLQDGDHALLDAVDEHALDRGHVFEQPRRSVARRAVVEPAERQLLYVRVKVAAQIKNHPLLKRVVQHDAQRIEHIAQQKRARRAQRQPPDPIAAPEAHIVDDELRNFRKHHHEQRPEDRAGQRPQCHRTIAVDVGEDAKDGSHRERE